MKVYFEDGTLTATHQLNVGARYLVNAASGYTNNEQFLDRINQESRDVSVYTNSIVPLINAQRYCWSEELNTFEIYILDKTTGEFQRIDELTDRELRFAHNVFSLWISGAFKR